MKYIITDITKLKNLTDYIGQMMLHDKVPEVDVAVHDPARSLDQNDLIYALYTDIAKQKSDETTLDVKRRLKLHHGVPILRAEDKEFRYFYNQTVLNLDYESKLRAMDILPVTSRMKKKQSSQYIDTILNECAELGLKIEIPYET